MINAQDLKRHAENAILLCAFVLTLYRLVQDYINGGSDGRQTAALALTLAACVACALGRACGRTGLTLSIVSIILFIASVFLLNYEPWP